MCLYVCQSCIDEQGWKETPEAQCSLCGGRHEVQKVSIEQAGAQLPCNGLLPASCPTRYKSDLEAFMMEVAKKLKCLPSFADPAPDEGNSHIIKKLDKLIDEAGR